MKPLSIGLRFVALPLGLAIASGPLLAQTNSPAEDQREPDLDTIVVTGSRIPTDLDEGPSPVTILTTEDIEKRGFTTVLEAASALTQITGWSQNEIDANGFTPNAGVVNLRALGPGRTLILVDGRRMTDYPLAYDSVSNFVNLTSIPAAAVERIELLAGGASAIYGSDAVAGVLNIVLRKDIDTPLDFNIRYGDTTQGAGESQRLQGVGGWGNDSFKLVYAAEYLHRDPIYGLDRDFMDSVADNPDPEGRINPRALLRADPFDLDGDGFDYIDPGAAACQPFSNMVYSTRPGRGRYCGQPNDPAQQSIRNDSDRGSLYTRATYNIGDQEVYGTLNFFQSKSWTDANFSFYFPLAAPYVFNTATDPFGFGGTYEVLQRFFQLDEIGGRHARGSRFDERLVDGALGIAGEIGSSAWRYDASFSRSYYRVKTRTRSLLEAEVDNYFLGEQIGLDPNLGFIPAYNFDIGRLYEPLTPDVWNQLTSINEENANSYNNVAQVVVNGELFDLPAGRVGMAGVLEFGRQSYQISPDPRLVAGEFWGFTGTGGGGKRERAAVGLEFRVPVLKTLTAQVAGRYDDYDDVTSVNNAISYNLGLEFRPVEQLLFRGSLATSFRAPDMHFVFADPSGFFTNVTDEFLCRRDEPNVPLPACTNGFVNVEGTRSGNPGLKEEEGDSYTLGFVFEPIRGLTFKADYYNIKLSGAVLDFSEERILELEADCRLGETKGGDPVDINSERCQDALSRVEREPDDGTIFAEALRLISTNPINTADIETSGIDAAARYLWETAGAGSFDFTLAWSHTLKYDQRDFEGDPIENVRDHPQTFDWRSRMNGSVTWNYGPFSTTAYAERFGSLPNWAETARIRPIVYMNLSAIYRFGENAEAGVFVDNVFNREPRRDPTFDQWPYFSHNNYDPVGREWFVQLRYRFD